MFKAIGNFFRETFGTSSKPVLDIPEKIEPPIFELGPEKTNDVQNVTTKTKVEPVSSSIEKVKVEKKPRVKKTGPVEKTPVGKMTTKKAESKKSEVKKTTKTTKQQ